MARRVVIAAGGTGGHLYPGLVLAKTLRERGWEPLMLVRGGDSGLPALEREGLPAVEIELEGLPRALSPRIIPFAWKLWRSLWLTRRIVRDFHPDAVVGMGGYLTFPVILAAALRGVPRVVHDSNAVLGLANSLAVRLGARLYWGMPPASGSGRVTGTPIRPALWRIMPRDQARGLLGLDPLRTTVLVFGGSQGARGINRALPPALATAANAAPDKLQVLHLSGPKEEEAVRKAYEGAPLTAKVLPFLEAMDAAYAAADLVVSRSGASTLAELAAQRKPAVLVPFPYAAAGHQEANARVLERAGAALVLLEESLPAYLASLLADLLLSPRGADDLKAMSEAYSKLALPPPERAAQALADAIENEATHTGVQR
ncbi:MAG: UDP-N-acetylglucosamine--N-acetylmuramyl-(pentapeptide) pyrophosphoryl-undecaprenol N-acetylglucosamine transferase [Elusimicrobia bacterium]|nr:UDP-N-acetylglucosamine--N-acetylmuramyl-(pentapeptide) pyrophosphoryl-undecaprenol N-acetylglucosamine transferase [Elusimicrobiota bacterium]